MSFTTVSIGWVVLALMVGILANTRGRSGIGWFVLSLLLSPLVGFAFAAALPNRMPAKDARRAEAQMKRCPRCAETVQRQALVCRHCGYDGPGLSDVGVGERRPLAETPGGRVVFTTIKVLIMIAALLFLGLVASNLLARA